MECRTRRIMVMTATILILTVLCEFRFFTCLQSGVSRKEDSDTEKSIVSFLSPSMKGSARETKIIAIVITACRWRCSETQHSGLQWLVSLLSQPNFFPSSFSPTTSVEQLSPHNVCIPPAQRIACCIYQHFRPAELRASSMHILPNL
jgi:hypothetical protein